MGGRKHTHEFIKNEFEKRGYTLLSKEYINSYTPLDFICDKGCVSQIRWNSLREGCGCYNCGQKRAGKSRVKNNANKIATFLAKSGAKFLSESECHSHFTTFICSCGDCDTLNWRSIKGNGGYCKICSIKLGVKKSQTTRKYTYEFVKTFFEEEGFKLLTETYINSKQPLTCLCPNGHLIKPRFYSFVAGARCGKCFYISQRRSLEEIEDSDRKYREYAQWKKLVLERDRYVCQACNSDKNLVVHHINSFKLFPLERTILNNGITLCVDCHARNNNAFHRLFSLTTEITKENFEKWLKIVKNEYD